MRKKLIFLLSTMAMAIGAISTFALLSNNSLTASATNETYKLVMNSSKNKLHPYTGNTPYSGDTIVQTNLGSDINFTYVDLMGGISSTWHVAKSGGQFYNVSPLHGLESISLSFKTADKTFKLYWGYDTSFNEDDSQEFTSSTSSSTLFNFDGDYPIHFKFVNTSGSNLNISEVELTYSCQNNYPSLSISSENTTMGTVSGASGVIRSGQNVSITATPNSGYRFVGWYSGNVLVSSNATYNFVMGYDDLNYVARFTYQSYNFVVESESVIKGSVDDISGSYNYYTPMKIKATANEGYTFQGWYKGEELISTNNPYAFRMPYADTTYTAKFSTNSYSLTLINYNPTLGTISDSNSYLYGSSVTIVATSNTGVSFLGWYGNNNNLVSSLSAYTFDMPHEDLTYTAKFAWTPYSVNVAINDTSMGSVTGSGSYTYGQNVTLLASPNEHYSFFGWYDGETLLSQNNEYSFVMPDESLDYNAKFVRNYELYIISDDESKGTVSSLDECGEGFEVTVTANAKIGYALDYWYDDDLNEVSYDSSYTFIMPNHDVFLYATFTEGYTLTVTSSFFTVTGSGQYVPGRNVTVSIDYNGESFEGWFNDNDQFVSMDNPYTFVMPSSNYYLEARLEEEWIINHGAIPTLSNDEKTITYGLYPQTNVNDSSLISALNGLTTQESNGWYLYEEEYYAKISATPFDSEYKFDNGTTIVNGTTYWFKCEPITWNVLTNNDGEYYILSSVLLDAHRYNEAYYGTIDGLYANNYKHSEIRSWLNDDFYNSAFAIGNSYIQITNVDNSASTTDSSTNQYACENTLDKVFLPSYQDYLNSSYGFSTSTATSTRCCRTTDWARARGSWYSTISPYYYNGCYWTRSPFSNYSYYAWNVYYAGLLSDADVYYTYSSVRPSLTLSIA